jgi:hypothetical protein
MLVFEAAHALSANPFWQVPVLSQQPRQFMKLQPLPPDEEHWPPVQTPPLAVQSWHAAPAAPHCVSPTRLMHRLPLQQPWHVDALHVDPASPPPA